MKKILISILIVLTSCINDKQEVPYFNIETSELEVSYESCLLTVGIETNIEWHLESKLPEWILVELFPDTGISLTIRENKEKETRSATLVISTEIGNYLLDIVQLPFPELSIESDKSINVSDEGGEVRVKIGSNVGYEIEYLNDSDNWVRRSFGLLNNSIASDTIVFVVSSNELPEEREAFIKFFNKQYNLSDTLSIRQRGKRTSVGQLKDGDWFLMNKATKGGANIIILGDGFTSKHLGAGGLYENTIWKAYENFFSILPYSNYREYFNVYGMIAESEDEGIAEKNSMGLDTFENKFGTAFGDGTEIVCDSDKIFEFCRTITEIGKEEIITVIVVLNSSKYAGTAYMLSDGNAIALCPMSTEEPPNDFEGIIHHEAGGHAFGLLCDEYVYNQSEMPNDVKSSLQTWQGYGFYLNLDFTDDLSKILWSSFIGLEKYKNVGAYEGGHEYQFGVWRCEDNSCMNNNVPYYNAQSRWLIVNRIMQLSGLNYSIQDFIEDDVVPANANTKSYVIKHLPALGTPVLVDVH